MAPFEESTAKPTETKDKPVVTVEVILNIALKLKCKEKNGKLSESLELCYKCL